MPHKPIRIDNLSFELPHRDCFSGFSTQIQYGEKIGIIGRNGSGKSSLLKIIMGELDSSGGEISNLDGINIGYVPQTITNFEDMSGGERFNRALSEALADNPDILILDEPTNHLDQQTRYSLMRMLDNYDGTLIVATHDTNFLNQCIKKLWHIDNGRVSVFSGNYEDYIRERGILRDVQERKLEILRKERKKLKEAKIRELQKSAKGSKSKPRDNERLNFNAKKSRGQATSDAKVSAIVQKMDEVRSTMSDNRLPEELNPSFIIENDRTALSKSILNISSGMYGYADPVISSISLSLSGQDKISISGNNGSGKTTLLKAIMGNEEVWTDGDWLLPNRNDIGYVDQHYSTLSPDKTVEEIIYDQNPSLSHAEIRKHLNSFLFRKNEEVFEKVERLSGGEKARLSLAQIAAKPPKLLILDEITNNVDIETKQYIVQVLRQYPGAMIVISHEPDFLKQLPLTGKYVIERGRFMHEAAYLAQKVAIHSKMQKLKN